MNVLDFLAMKNKQEKISMVTCYDYTTARILSESNVDCLLVGDSVAMTVHGHPDTLLATLEMMSLHTGAVKRGVGKKKFIITDMPFLSYRKSLSQSVDAAHGLMQAGAQAIKIENAAGNLHLIHHLTESGIPVMGHLGLTMQLMHSLGGLKVQGKTEEAAIKMLSDAKALTQAGCFAIVLECIPKDLAESITSAIPIPTIGIGAGLGTDGQVLVIQDLLGMNLDFKPKFVKQFAEGASLILDGVNHFVAKVKNKTFPTHEYTY